MIEDIFARFDEYYLFISNNEKKIAKENMLAIKAVIYFSMVGGFAYFVSSWAFRITTKMEPIFIQIILELVVFNFLYNKLYPRISDSLRKVRVFAFSFYGLILITLAYTETFRNPGMRSFILPAGIFIITAIYKDYLMITNLFEIAVCVICIVISFIMKPREVANVDIVTIIMTFFLATFALNVIMLNNSRQNQDVRSVEKKSVTDLLTGLFNKLSFEEKCKEYLSGRVVGAKATLFIFDFDNFKSVNDNYGHQTGDEALKLFAHVLKDYFHPTDVVGRVGGDEFMVLVMGEMPEDFINSRCNKIQHELRVAKVGDAAGFSCSIGVCEDKNARTFEEMYKIADSALYDAKENGKACHVVKRE